MNKPLHHGRICRWLLLFQDFEFEVVVEPRKANVRPDHLSRVESRKYPKGIDDDLPDAHLLRVEAILAELAKISHTYKNGKHQNITLRKERKS